MMNTTLGLAVLLGVLTTLTAHAQWQPAAGPLLTRWAKDVSPDKVHPEYPRPRMVRPDWQNLNGLWDYAIRPKADAQPREWEGRILVPFPVEAALSGVMKRVDETQGLWYRRSFEVPAKWSGQRVLLHFGAVDWEAAVWVNGKELGTHRGGYDPFTFDITDALKPSGEQEIVVAVWDPTDAGYQPRGKQVRKPEGIWYTPTTGIWQTVWLEPVPAARIDDLRVIPSVDDSSAHVQIRCPPDMAMGCSFTAAAFDGEREVARASGTVAALSPPPATAGASQLWTSLTLNIPNAKLWSPDAPFLYGLTVTLAREGQRVDELTSYFGMRKVSLGKDDRGVTRLLLNNKPLFMLGLLDQGFWPDGLYTAPTDEASRYDIEVTRKLGFNLARKHVKIEPERWYYWCDKLGLLVWQDMPSGDKIDAGPDYRRTRESADQFELELKRLIDARGHHPSIVMWVPFNEGWGQYETGRIVEWIRKYGPTRLVNSASGWHDLRVGDVHDIHAYPGPAAPPPDRAESAAARAGVLGEFGGLGLPVAGHLWLAEKSWGYRSFQTREELTDAYVGLLGTLRWLAVDSGLSAAVYTQTTDVEIEVNGLMTYDRELIKPDLERIAAANRKLYLPPPVVTVVVPSAKEAAEAPLWRYTTTAPPQDWLEPAFDDTSWPEGRAGFGRAGTPGAVVGTEWTTGDIWIRRSFELPKQPKNPTLKLYHDEDCEVYLNGKAVAKVGGYTTAYVLVPLADPAALRSGRNVIAVHCRQTAGGQGVDVGLVDVSEPTGR